MPISHRLRTAARFGALAVACAALVPLAAGGQAQPAQPATQAENKHDPAHHAMETARTVVIIARHAEKSAPSGDIPLSDAGLQRAQALAKALVHSKVDVVMHTPTIRTRDTAKPTAEAFKLTSMLMPLGGPAPVHAAAVAELVRQHAGKTILVVGHSNTVLRYVEALGGPKLPDLCDHEYDTLFTLVIEGPKVQLIVSRYGAPNAPATDGCQGMERK